MHSITLKTRNCKMAPASEDARDESDVAACRSGGCGTSALGSSENSVREYSVVHCGDTE